MKSQSMECQIKIDCEFSELLEIAQLKEHPRNRNSHSKEQLDRLAKLIRHHGFRHPIIISKLTGYIVAGHGRLEAAKILGMKGVPVDYQEFPDADAEYAFLISDNSIAAWAELDLSGINADLGDLGPDFDIDLLGIKDFVLEPLDHGLDDKPDQPEQGEKHFLEVELSSEKEMMEVYEELLSRGLIVRLK